MSKLRIHCKQVTIKNVGGTARESLDKDIELKLNINANDNNRVSADTLMDMMFKPLILTLEEDDSCNLLPRKKPRQKGTQKADS